MDIMPFAYGLEVQQVYDQGSLFSPAVLDITPEQVVAKFHQGAKNVAAVSIELSMPTAVSVPYSLLMAFSNLLAVAAETEFSFKEAEEIKAYLADPSAFASAAPVAAAGGGGGAAAAAVVEEEEEEEDMAPATNLFGGDGDDY